MEFSKEDLDGPKEIYKRQTGQELADDEAIEIGERLIRLVKIFFEIAHPETTEGIEPIKRNHQRG